MRSYANETMTCVDRYAGQYLQIYGNQFQYALYRKGLGEKLYLTVHWLYVYREVDFRDVLQCRAGTELFEFTDMEGWEDPVCVLPYLTDDAGTGEALYALVPKNPNDFLYLNFVEQSTIPLYPGSYQTLPSIQMRDTILAANYTQNLRWILTPGDNRTGWAVHMEMRYRDPGAAQYETVTLFSEVMQSYYQITTDSTILGKEVCLWLEYRTFAPDWDGHTLEDFVTLNCVVTPWNPVNRDASFPLSPENIAVSMLLAGGRVTVQWSAVNDPLMPTISYRLERAVADPGETPIYFRQLYKGTSTQFRDTLPEDAGSVIYRVCTVNGMEVESPWTETGIREIAQSNLYVSRGGTWMRAAGIWIGDRRASPMAKVK